MGTSRYAYIRLGRTNTAASRLRLAIRRAPSRCDVGKCFPARWTSEGVGSGALGRQDTQGRIFILMGEDSVETIELIATNFIFIMLTY